MESPLLQMVKSYAPTSIIEMSKNVQKTAHKSFTYNAHKKDDDFETRRAIIGRKTGVYSDSVVYVMHDKVCPLIYLDDDVKNHPKRLKSITSLYLHLSSAQLGRILPPKLVGVSNNVHKYLQKAAPSMISGMHALGILKGKNRNKDRRMAGSGNADVSSIEDEKEDSRLSDRERMSNFNTGHTEGRDNSQSDSTSSMKQDGAEHIECFTGKLLYNEDTSLNLIPDEYFYLFDRGEVGAGLNVEDVCDCSHCESYVTMTSEYASVSDIQITREREKKRREREGRAIFVQRNREEKMGGGGEGEREEEGEKQTGKCSERGEIESTSSEEFDSDINIHAGYMGRIGINKRKL